MFVPAVNEAGRADTGPVLAAVGAWTGAKAAVTRGDGGRVFAPTGRAGMAGACLGAASMQLRHLNLDGTGIH